MKLFEIQNHLENKMLEVLITLETKLKRTLPVPALELKQLGRIAGRANSNINKIQINPDYCLNGNWEQTRNVTLPHEIAHIVADFIYVNDYRNKGIVFENRPHGHLWKRVMGLIGLPPERCHSMSLDGVKTVTRMRPKPFKYACQCRTHMVSLVRHNRAQKGKYVSFKCRICNGDLTFVGRA